MKKLVDLDNNIDLEEAAEGAISSYWVKYTKILDTYTPASFKEYLFRQTILFRVLRTIIEELYATTNSKEFDTSRSIADNLMYFEGYKHALRDVYKLIPRPKGE